MIASIFSSCLFIMAEPTPAPTSALIQLGFTEVRPPRVMTGSMDGLHKDSRLLTLTASNKAGERIRMDISWLADSSSGRLHSYALGSPSHLTLERRRHAVPASATELPSGLPPDHVQVYSIDDRSSFSINVQTLWASVRCIWTPYIGTSDKGYAVIGEFDRKAKQALVEKVIRHSLANASGLRIEANGNGTLAGYGVSRAKRRGSNVMFGDLNQWFSASGWGIAEEDKFGLLHLKKGSDWAVLPLGADQIKVNGVWREMGDSAAFFNGKLYLPAAGLEHLKGA